MSPAGTIKVQSLCGSLAISLNETNRRVLSSSESSKILKITRCDLDAFQTRSRCDQDAIQTRTRREHATTKPRRRVTFQSRPANQTVYITTLQLLLFLTTHHHLICLHVQRNDEQKQKGISPNTCHWQGGQQPGALGSWH